MLYCGHDVVRWPIPKRVKTSLFFMQLYLYHPVWLSLVSIFVYLSLSHVSLSCNSSSSFMINDISLTSLECNHFVEILILIYKCLILTLPTYINSLNCCKYNLVKKDDSLLTSNWWTAKKKINEHKQPGKKWGQQSRHNFDKILFG